MTLAPLKYLLLLTYFFSYLWQEQNQTIIAFQIDFLMESNKICNHDLKFHMYIRLKFYFEFLIIFCRDIEGKGNYNTVNKGLIDLHLKRVWTSFIFLTFSILSGKGTKMKLVGRLFLLFLANCVLSNPVTESGNSCC